jgi:hypothetical protein
VTHSLIASSIDVVVYLAKNPLLDGRRCVVEIVEVAGVSDGRVTQSRIFTPSPVDGRAVRDVEIPIIRAGQLAAAGYDDTTGGGWPDADGWN